MPRPRKPAPTLPSVELDHAAIARAQAARDELALHDEQAAQATLELARKLGYDGPLEPELLEHGIVQQMRRTAEACLEMGRMLLLLRERCGHGNFADRLDRLGIAPRAAQKFMQAAFKFAKAPAATALLRAAGSQTKLIELLVLDDDEIEALAQGEPVRGIELDDIDAMTARELRAALRDARADAEAKDRLLEQKNKKLDKLSTQRRFVPPEGSVAETLQQQAQLDELHAATNAAEVTFLRLATVVRSIEYDSQSKAMRGRAVQAVQYLVQRLADVVEEHGIEVAIVDHVAVRPEWLDPLTYKGANSDDVGN